MQRQQLAPTPVSGRELLSSLTTFIRTYGAANWLCDLLTPSEVDLARGKRKFSLNPPCLKFLNAKFKEYKMGILFPGGADFVEPLLHYVQKATILRLEPTHKNKLDGMTEIDLSAFASLTTLEIELCKPSLIINVQALSTRLERITIHNTLNSLEELLAFEEVPISWPRLRELDCSNNSIPAIHKSIGTLSVLERLDLSHNIILRIENLSSCPHLDSINLSFNSIASVARLFEVLGNVRTLNLSNNRIQYTAGLEKLFALEHLDLSANLLSSSDEVRRLGGLPCLEALSLDGNPISAVAGYRDTVFGFFVPNEDFVFKLDGRPRPRTAIPPTLPAALSASPATTLQTTSVPPSPSTPRRRGEAAAQSVPGAAPTALGESGPAPGSTPSAASELKKKPKKRVAKIAEHVPAPPGAPAGTGGLHPPAALGAARSAEDEERLRLHEKEIVEFQSRVESIHKEGGTAWLLILSEMQKQDPPPFLPSASPAPPSVAPAADEGKDRPPSRPPSRGTPTPTPEPKAPEQRPMPLLNTDEYYVTTIRDPSSTTQEWDPRILIISDDWIREADVHLGGDVARYESRYLASITCTGEMNGKPIERLEFRFRDNRTSHVLYKLEDASVKAIFEKRLTTIISQKRFIPQLQCVKCSSVFAIPNGTLKQCLKCNSIFLVTYEPPPPKEPPSLLRESSQLNAALLREAVEADAAHLMVCSQFTAPPTALASLDSCYVALPHEVSDYSSADVDSSTQLYLKLNFYHSGADEQSNYVKFNSRIEEEQAWLLLTSEGIYVLAQVKKSAEHLRGFTLLAEHPLAKVKKVQVGLFYQFFRLEVEDGTSHVFLTRDHFRTHRFVELMHQTAKESDDNFFPLELCHLTKETYATVSLLVGSKKRVMLNLYIMLFRKNALRGAQYKSLQPLHPEKVVPRSLVLTDDQVLLCEEEVCKPVAQGKTQFVCESMHALSDVTTVELDCQAPLGLKIVFEKEGEVTESEPWELVCQSPLEKERILKHLRAAWRAIFKLDLNVTERGPAQWPSRASLSKC